MLAKQITFLRPQKFLENGAPVSPAQHAAATHTVLVGSPTGAAHAYTVPAALVPAGTGPVAVPFAALGFAPTAGVTYTVQVVTTIDGVDSEVSKPVTFTNSFTPAAPEAVSIS